VDPRRITVTPAGPFLGDGHPPEPFGSRLGEDAAPGPERPYLFVGALDTNHAYKRLDRLIDAVARLRDDGVRVDVEVVGDGGTRTAFERMARRLGLSDRVRFLGRLGDLELAERYRTAWALVLPATSGSEGFGVVVGEAAWYGCPSVVSSAVASSEFWSALGVARIYDSQSPRGLEEALRTLWESPRDRHALSHATPAVRDRLSWDHLLPETLTPIRSLLGSARIR
jgi:glycosyltransferase involved in cell wall biosynthesis